MDFISTTATSAAHFAHWERRGPARSATTGVSEPQAAKLDQTARHNPNSKFAFARRRPSCSVFLVAAAAPAKSAGRRLLLLMLSAAED